MNNRGKALSHLELLKNRLIYLSTILNTDEHERVKLRNVVNDTWKMVYHYLGKNKDNPLDDDVFLRHHFLHYFGHGPVKKFKKMVDEEALSARMLRGFQYKDFLLEVIFTTKNIKVGDEHEFSLKVKDIYTYANSLKESIDVWYNLLNPSEGNFTSEELLWLEKLNRNGIMTVAPLLMAYYIREPNPKFRVRLLKILERVLFLFTAIGSSQPSLLRDFNIVDATQDIGSGKNQSEKALKDIEQFIDKHFGLDTEIFIDYFVRKVRNDGFYSWNAIKYFLFEYELELKNQTKSFRDKLNWETFSDINEDRRDHATIEHIYPQRPREACWTAKFSKYTDKERTILRHSLGNLVPLSQPKNSSFQNKCFAVKKGSSETKIGFAYGSLSEIEVAHYTDWTAREILYRGLKLLDFFEKRWVVNFGDKRRKVQVLGLEFVVAKENLDYDDL